MGSAHNHLLHDATDIPATQAALPMAADDGQPDLIFADKSQNLLGGVSVEDLRLRRDAYLLQSSANPFQVALCFCPAQLPLQWVHRAQAVLPLG